MNNLKYSALVFLVTGFIGSAFAEIGERPEASSVDPLNLKGKGVISKIESLPDKMSEHAKAKLVELQQQKFITVPDQVVDKFTIENLSAYLEPLESIHPQLSVSLSDIAGTPFDDMRFHGAIPHSKTSLGKWSGVSRIFSLPGEKVVRLYEWNFISANGGVSIQEEFINESVNGNPAILLVEKGTKGTAITTLKWIEDDKYYTIEMSGHVRGKGHENKLIQYAQSLR